MRSTNRNTHSSGSGVGPLCHCSLAGRRIDESITSGNLGVTSPSCSGLVVTHTIQCLGFYLQRSGRTVECISLCVQYRSLLSLVTLYN